MKRLAVLVAALMVFSAAGFALASAAPFSTPSISKEHVVVPSYSSDIIKMHGKGLIKVPLSEYEKVTGFKVPYMNAKAFEQAIKNVPSYPGRSTLKAKLLGSRALEAQMLPSEVLNTLYLPPVGDQGWVGSCNAWSSTYYVWTYMLNWWRHNPHPTGNAVMNPTFTYNLINGGADTGSNMWDAMNLLSTVGAVGLNQFPLYTYPPFPSDYAWVWPNETQWMIAPHNRGVYSMYDWQYNWPANNFINGQWYILDLTNITQWQYMKGLLSAGYVLQTAINVLPSFDFLEQPGSFVGYLVFYANYANKYAAELWANQSEAAKLWDNGSYANWTFGQLINWVYNTYNGTYGMDAATYYSLFMFINILTQRYGIKMTDTIPVAASKLMAGVEEHYINNQTWWQQASFYLSAYSAKGEAWLLNHGFADLYALANFEWMIHYIPLGVYASTRLPYINFYNYYFGWQGGHAVTIIGYDDSMQTPDGKGALIMMNSWGKSYGINGTWYFSYQAVRSAGKVYNTTVDGILPVYYMLEWPVSWGGSSAFVYVPKAPNYTPKVMAVVGISHPVRGEVVDGVYNNSNYNTIISAGIPVGVSVNNHTWEHYFLDFWIDYIGIDSLSNLSEIPASAIPQDHPFPNSPMAFDISNALSYIAKYINSTSVTFFVEPHDILKDNITGNVTEFGVVIKSKYFTETVMNTTTVKIPDGGYTVVKVTVPVVKYGSSTPASGAKISKDSFTVSVESLLPLKAAYIKINGKKYEMKGNGYDFSYTVSGLKDGTYTYVVCVVYENGNKVALPSRTITVSLPKPPSGLATFTKQAMSAQVVIGSKALTSGGVIPDYMAGMYLASLVGTRPSIYDTQVTVQMLKNPDNVFISIGGPLVNGLTSELQAQAPVKMTYSNGTITITAPNFTVTWKAPTPWWNVTKGYWVVQRVRYDGTGATVYMIYGTDMQSTWAGAYWFYETLKKDPSMLNGMNYVVGCWANTQNVPFQAFLEHGSYYGFSPGDKIKVMVEG